jgi:hypothetical protein
MRITIKLFGGGEQEPRFVGTLDVAAAGAPSSLRPAELSTEDLKLLWDVERAINHHVAGRCHIEVNE